MNFLVQLMFAIIPVVFAGCILYFCANNRKLFYVMCVMFVIITTVLIYLVEMHQNVISIYALSNVSLIVRAIDKYNHKT